MNKDELEQKLANTTKLLKKEKENNVFLLQEQQKFVKAAEDAGSKANAYKQMVMRLRDELERLDLMLNNLKR